MKMFKQSILRGFQYSPPSSKREMIADFYVLSMIYSKSSPSNNDNKQEFRDEDIDETIRETTNTLLINMKKEMMQSIYLACCSEYVHVYSEHTRTYNEKLQISSKNKRLYEKYKNILKKLDLMNYNDHMIISWYTSSYEKLLEKLKSKNILKENELTQQLIEQKEDPKLIYRYELVNLLNTSEANFMSLFKEVMQKEKLREEWGGEAWINIANAWFLLNNANTIQDMFVYIDHVLDLEHNSGTIFDKRKSYLDQNLDNKNDRSFDWIESMLNLKLDEGPWELIPFCSSQMKQLAAYKLRMKGWGSMENIKEYEKPPFPPKDLIDYPELYFTLPQKLQDKASFKRNFKIGMENILTSLEQKETTSLSRYYNLPQNAKEIPEIKEAFIKFKNYIIKQLKKMEVSEYVMAPQEFKQDPEIIEIILNIISENFKVNPFNITKIRFFENTFESHKLKEDLYENCIYAMCKEIKYSQDENDQVWENLESFLSLSRNFQFLANQIHKVESAIMTNMQIFSIVILESYVKESLLTPTLIRALENFEVNASNNKSNIKTSSKNWYEKSRNIYLEILMN